MLTEAEKTDTRRFGGYPALAGQAVFQQSATLEHRLAHLAPAEEAVLRDYLATLRGMEQAIPAAAKNLDTAQVSVWSRNPAEMRDRNALFDNWRRRLCGFLGVPPGVHMARGGVSFIV
jgi:hypothetical protein